MVALSPTFTRDHTNGHDISKVSASNTNPVSQIVWPHRVNTDIMSGSISIASEKVRKNEGVGAFDVAQRFPFLRNTTQTEHEKRAFCGMLQHFSD